MTNITIQINNVEEAEVFAESLLIRHSSTLMSMRRHAGVVLDGKPTVYSEGFCLSQWKRHRIELRMIRQAYKQAKQAEREFKLAL